MRLGDCFFELVTDDLAVALGAPLRREAEEDFVMVGDEKREKIKSYGGTGTEGYVGSCCWRKLEMLLKFEIFAVQ
jgi:hypothetical protein